MTFKSAVDRLRLYKSQIRRHMEYYSHLWASDPQCQLLPLDGIQRSATRIIDDWALSDRLDPLALRRDVGSLCILYRFYYGKCFDKLFGLIPPAEFHHRTSRLNSKFHPHYLDVWTSTTVLFSKHFLPRTTASWKQLPADVFPNRYDLGAFKKRAYLYFKGRQRIYMTSGTAAAHGQR